MRGIPAIKRNLNRELKAVLLANVKIPRSIEIKLDRIKNERHQITY